MPELKSEKCWQKVSEICTKIYKNVRNNFHKKVWNFFENYRKKSEKRSDKKYFKKSEKCVYITHNNVLVMCFCVH